MPSLQSPCDDMLASSDFSGDIGARGDSVSPSDAESESGVLFVNLHLRDCRICHSDLESNSREHRSPSIELGCSCKADLAYAHKQCAETWFKIRGNMTCEICGSTAVNISCEQTNNSINRAAEASTTSLAPVIHAVNFLLTCIIFAFVVSWLFHFKIFP